MNSIYDQLGEACRQFGERVGASLKEANDLMATNSRRERGMNENLADEIRQQIEKCKGLKLDIGEINNHLSTLEGLVRNDIEGRKNEAYQRGFEDGKAQVERGCDGCKYAGKVVTGPPCITCCNSYKNQWTAKDDEIEVGDEVEWDNNFTGDRFIVTRIYQPYGKKEQCDGIDDDGDVYRAVLIESLVKTGRHFDIASILEDMRND